MRRASILPAHAALGTLDYRVPAGMDVPVGSYVEVPIGPRAMLGVVWDSAPDTAGGNGADVPDAKLRPITRALPLPPMPAELRRLVAWTADYYLAPQGSVLKMCIPAMTTGRDGRIIALYRASGTPPARMTDQRAKALAAIGDEEGSIAELAKLAGVSDTVVRGLVHCGALTASGIEAPARPPKPDPDFAAPALSPDQQQAAQHLRGAIGSGFQPYLLDGVTGSGKTEVYFEAVAQCLRAGKQVLILLPEIALTEPMLRRFADRFGCEPVTWHSGIRQSERRRNWRAIVDGTAAVTIGARSALFLPYSDLGLIIVDEAHEASFKQEDGVHYHARDVAVMRGKFCGIPVILASATHAIESRAQVENGTYRHIALPARFGGAVMPEMRAVDLRTQEPERGSWLAKPLVDAISARLERGEQSLLFLNRRGYAPLTLCRTCGHRFQCPNCTAWMVEHRIGVRLSCHHCGHTEPPPRACPECASEDSLVACGPGVERVAHEVNARWPDARTAVVTSDTLWNPERAAEFVESMEQGLIDIVIGTQLVTKGYHFPNLTLVGVVDADIGLAGGDLRASERSFQQIAQVAGRAGRAEKSGEVLVQTRQPDAPVIAALIAGDADAFYAAEHAARREAGMPPYGRLAAIIIASEDAKAAESAARDIGNAAPDIAGVDIWGPAPAALSMLRGRHRHRILVQAPRAFQLQRMLRTWLEGCHWPAKVRVAVDIDPYNFV